MSKLSELVNHHWPGSKTHREVADEIKGQGKAISATWIYRVRNGTHPPQPRDSQMQILAEYLDIPIDQMREAAAVPPGETEPFKLPAEADRLDDEQREVIRHMVKVLLRSDRTVRDNERSSAPIVDLDSRRPPATDEQRPMAGREPHKGIEPGQDIDY